jgi:hypothetical protein
VRHRLFNLAEAVSLETARIILMVVLGALSLVSVPTGIYFGSLGLGGRLADSSYRDNVRTGLLLLAIGMAPPVLLALCACWGWIRRRKLECRGFAVGLSAHDQPTLIACVGLLRRHRKRHGSAAE